MNNVCYTVSRNSFVRFHLYKETIIAYPNDVKLINNVIEFGHVTLS